MNVIHRSSSGCHVTVGDVAPDTRVSNKMRRRGLTNLSQFDEQRHLSLLFVVASLPPSIELPGACLFVVATVRCWEESAVVGGVALLSWSWSITLLKRVVGGHEQRWH
jgi:hypothetical protein